MRARQKKSDRMGMQFVKLKMFSLTAASNSNIILVHTSLSLTNYFFSLINFLCETVTASHKVK